MAPDRLAQGRNPGRAGEAARGSRAPFTSRGTRVANSWSVEDRTLVKASEARSRAAARAVAGVPWPRVGNLVIGVWLQVSAFTWPRPDDSRLSAWLPGLLISIVALLSMGAPPMRWLNAFLALWLLLWTFAATCTEPVSYASGVISAVLVFVLATIPSKSAATDYRD